MESQELISMYRDFKKRKGSQHRQFSFNLLNLEDPGSPGSSI